MEQQIFGNTLGGSIWLGSWLLGGFFFKKLFADGAINLIAWAFRKWLYDIPAERFRALLSKSLSILIFIICIYIAIQYVDFPRSWDLDTVKNFGLRKVLYVIYEFVFGLSLSIVILKLIDCISLVISRKYEVNKKNASVEQIIPFATDFIKIIVGCLAGLIILSTLFNINVGALVAGLGIGGLAIAMAAKETLENLLGSFIIFIDKPFLVGDFVYLDNTYCTVDKVGLRSTRFRTIYRTYLTLPNKMVVENAIQNYTLRDMRRVDRIIQLSRKTTFSQIQKIRAEIKDSIIENKRTNSDSLYVNFHEISDFSLDIRVQYYVSINDWGVYLEVVEEINLSILEIIEKYGAELAYPTRIVDISK